MEYEYIKFLELAINSIRIQSSTIVAISSGGLLSILVVFGSIFGIKKDLTLMGFRMPGFLVIPLSCFAIAIALGYLVDASLTGFLMESSQGYSAQKEIIFEPNLHFADEYKKVLEALALSQLLFSLLGLLLLSLWFSVNILKRMK